MRGLKIAPACPGCRLRIDRGEEGHFLGSMTFNMVVSEIIVLALITASVVHSLPEMPPRSHLAGLMTCAVVLPILFFPFSRTLRRPSGWRSTSCSAPCGQATSPRSERRASVEEKRVCVRTWAR